MNWNEFLINALSNFIAMLPQLFMTLTTVVYALNGIKQKTATFPETLENTKVTLKHAFEESKTILIESFDDAKERMMNSFKGATEEMKSTLNGAIDDISQKVNGTLTNMQNELNGYKENLESTRNQLNMVVKENKLFMDTLITLLSQNPELIKQGISSKLIHKVNLTKDELETYPQILSTDLPILEKAIKEARHVVGEKNLDVLLDTLGYERKKL